MVSHAKRYHSRFTIRFPLPDDFMLILKQEENAAHEALVS